MREETIVVGARHMGTQVVINCLELTLGAPLILHREPGNPHDHNAILLSTVFGAPVGYVQRAVAAVVAPLMDNGTRVLGKVIRAPNMRAGRLRMRLRYPRALLWLDDPPAEVVAVWRGKPILKRRQPEKIDG